MWFKWWKNYPVRYIASDLGVAYVFSLLGAIAGLVWWIISGFRNIEALILMAAGIGLFFLFHFLIKNRLVPENETAQEKDE